MTDDKMLLLGGAVIFVGLLNASYHLYSFDKRADKHSKMSFAEWLEVAIIIISLTSCIAGALPFYTITSSQEQTKETVQQETTEPVYETIIINGKEYRLIPVE